MRADPEPIVGAVFQQGQGAVIVRDVELKKWTGGN
jgi:hypothetical protein